MNTTNTLTSISDRSEQHHGEWRKGLAIYHPNNCIINEEFQVVSPKLFIPATIESVKIHRVFGGRYFITAMAKYNYRTFPGQDRDTEYDLRPIVFAILDENGRLICEHSDEKPQFTQELGDNVVYYNNSFYRLDTYELIYSPTKRVIPLSKFIDGKCKISIISDYRDFYVAVNDKKIVASIDKMLYQIMAENPFVRLPSDEETFTLFWNVFNNCKKQQHKPYEKLLSTEAKAMNDDTHVVDYHLQPIVVIENYMYSFPKEFDIHDKYPLDNHFVYEKSGKTMEKYFIDMLIYHTTSRIYKCPDDASTWFKIDKDSFQSECEQLYLFNHSRPNYIQDISCLFERIDVQDEWIDYYTHEYSLYEFHCRPYGFFSKDGQFDYSFDVDNVNL